MLELARSGDLARFERLIYNVGGCENPVFLRGETLKRAIDTGLVVQRFSSDGSPVGAIAMRCMNRRASRCAPCAALYKGDTYQLVLAGLVGGIKGVPPQVRDHPKVFATLTAPSFGPVHRVTDPDREADRCRARRGSPQCQHGNPLNCDARHGPDGPVVGSPLCARCYDYAGQVLWNAHASKLFGSFVATVYHRLALSSGRRRADVRRLVRVEYVRNAEYQARGVVHFHVALRLDGPDDRADAPPAWATAEVLADAVVSAARTASVPVPASGAVGERVLRFGAQIDAHPLDGGGQGELASEKVAGYLAKYVSKSTEAAHGVDTPIRHASQIDLATKNPHVRSLMWAAWRLGGLRELEPMNIRHWTHMLGFRGHNTTASRLFSVTRGGLRQDRRDYRAEQERSRRGDRHTEPVGPVVTESKWWHVRSGYFSDPMATYAARVREDIAHSKEMARDALAEERSHGSRPQGGGAP